MSFFLLSFCLLPKVLRILPVIHNLVCVSCTFKDSQTHTYIHTDGLGLALQSLHCVFGPDNDCSIAVKAVIVDCCMHFMHFGLWLEKKNCRNVENKTLPSYISGTKWDTATYNNKSSTKIYVHIHNYQHTAQVHGPFWNQSHHGVKLY